MDRRMMPARPRLEMSMLVTAKKAANGRIGEMHQLVKILADGRDQADAGVEAGNHEDRREQHLTAPAEQTEREAGQCVRAGRAARERPHRTARPHG